MKLLDTFKLVTATALATALSFETAAEEEANENQNLEAQQGGNRVDSHEQILTIVIRINHFTSNLGAKAPNKEIPNNLTLALAEAMP